MVEFEALDIDGVEYLILDRSFIDGEEYLYLSNSEDENDVMFRKVDKTDNSILDVVLCDDLNILENKNSEKINYKFKYEIDEVILPLKKFIGGLPTNEATNLLFGSE